MNEIIEVFKKVAEKNQCDHCRKSLNNIIQAVSCGLMVDIAFTPDKNCSEHITHWHINYMSAKKFM